MCDVRLLRLLRLSPWNLSWINVSTAIIPRIAVPKVSRHFLTEFPGSSFPSVYSTMMWAALQKSFDISPKDFVSPAIYQEIPPSVHACSKIYSLHLMYFNCRYIKEMKTQCYQQRDKTNETKSHNDGHRPSTFHLAPPEDFMQVRVLSVLDLNSLFPSDTEDVVVWGHNYTYWHH